MAKKRQARRKVEKLVLEPLATTCPCCGETTRIDYHNQRTVHSDYKSFELTLKIRRCTTFGCDRCEVAHRPEAEWHYAPPSRRFSWSIISAAREKAGNAQLLAELRQYLARLGLSIRPRTLVDLASFGNRLVFDANRGLPETAVQVLSKQRYAVLNLLGFEGSIIAQEAFTGALVAEIPTRETSEAIVRILRSIAEMLPCPIEFCLCCPWPRIKDAAVEVFGENHVRPVDVNLLRS